MVAVGDIMLDRNVGRSIRRWGAASMVEKVRRQLTQANLTFANLECPLSTEGAHDPANCCFRADPATVEVLRAAGIDWVSLANNHFLNGGREAVLQTLEVLDQNHIAYAGARRERDKGLEPTFLQVGSVKVGALAFTDLSFEHGSYAKYDRDPRAACAAVTEARKQCDVLLVSMHWGEEYENMPNARQRETARALIDAGADCILGHHPHTLQGIGLYKNRPILYSMGNFIFDQREGERMESAIFDLWWKQNGTWQIRATPIWIESGRFRPVYPSPERAQKITARLAKITTALGTKVTVQNGCVVVRVPQ
jgi:poly-gamma-glutamate synthesis protein (capsule biosynthesis protein)